MLQKTFLSLLALAGFAYAQPFESVTYPATPPPPLNVLPHKGGATGFEIMNQADPSAELDQ